jgi:hypothetical protein
MATRSAIPVIRSRAASEDGRVFFVSMMFGLDNEGPTLMCLAAGAGAPGGARPGPRGVALIDALRAAAYLFVVMTSERRRDLLDLVPNIQKGLLSG